MTLPTARRALVLALAGAAALAAPAAATTGNLYLYGASIWATGSPFSGSVLDGPTFQVSAPAVALAPVGSKFEMNWGCPVAGSEIASVHWTALRYAAPSSLEQQVTVDNVPVWTGPDVQMPQSPAGGAPFAIAVPGGACNVHLRLWQTEARAQHARTYWIGDPRILVRDLTAPAMVLWSVTGGWIRSGQNSAHVIWSAGDNFGSDGMGWQRILVAGGQRWAGQPGQGDFDADVDLSGVADGAQPVRVEVDGDGTPGIGTDAWVYIDRTAPGAWGFASGYSGAPGRADLAWTAGDNVSGVAGSEAQLNAATDGSVTGAWIRAAGAAGGDGARSLPGVVTSVVPDGVHAWRVRVTDVAGNGSEVLAPGTIVVDTTPPSVDLAPIPAAWTARLPLDVTIGDNLQGALGLGVTEVAVNAAADGSASGPWSVLASSVRTPGRHVQSLALPGLPDGPHLVRVRTQNGGPFWLVTERTATLRVDLTSPALTGVSFSAGSDSVTATWSATDERAGVAAARLEWLDGGSWRTLAEKAVGNGAGALTASLTGVPEGPRALRLVVTDAAGNAATATTSAAGSTVDRTPPSVSGLRLEGPPWVLRWTQEDSGSGLGACATSILVSGAATDGWREILAPTLGPGAQAVPLPVEGLDPGTYRVRVIACDAVGNTTTAETAGLTVARAPAEGTTVVIQPGGQADAGFASPGSPAEASDEFAEVRRGRLVLRVRDARLERFAGRAFWVRRIRFGERVRIEGRLLTAAGRPVRRAEIHVRGYKDRILGRALTGRDGRFRVAVRPEAGGVLRIGVPAGERLLPGRQSAGVRVVVTPVVTFRPSTRNAVAFGAPVAFRGRLQPAPALLGGEPRKGVILEWLDPTRRVWRPVLNARARRDGGFRLLWRFQSRGLTIPMRVRIPVERGWPLTGALSGTVAIRVR